MNFKVHSLGEIELQNHGSFEMLSKKKRHNETALKEDTGVTLRLYEYRQNNVKSKRGY